jgi:putative phosphoribosyl transferase
MIFTDRQHAGQLLGKKLIGYKDLNPIILALPRGGIPVAAEIAAALNAPLEVLVVRKIGHPLQQELAVGALCEDKDPVWNERILSRMGLAPDDLGRAVLTESKKIKQQIEAFRQGRKLPSMVKKTAIVVDDGLATGATVLAAVKYLKKKGVAKIILAVPVAAASSARQLRTKVDSIICLEEPEDLLSVGQWYKDFSQVNDEEVVMILKDHHKKNEASEKNQIVEIPVDEIILNGDLTTFP